MSDGRWWRCWRPLPGLQITWIDTAPERFPENMPAGVAPVWAGAPEGLADHAPPGPSI
jgi:xanthine dehydrogenase accessory factor